MTFCFINLPQWAQNGQRLTEKIVGPTERLNVQCIHMYGSRRKYVYIAKRTSPENFGRTSHELQASFVRTSGRLRTNLEPTSGQLRANFERSSGRLRAKFERSSGRLRANLWLNFVRTTGTTSKEPLLF